MFRVLVDPLALLRNGNVAPQWSKRLCFLLPQGVFIVTRHLVSQLFRRVVSPGAKSEKPTFGRRISGPPKLGVECLEGRIAPSSFPQLPPTGFAVLALSGDKLSMTNPKTTVVGDVGLEGGVQQNLADGQVQGNYLLASGLSPRLHNVAVTGDVQTSHHISQAQEDAVEASKEIAALHPTLSLGSINHSTTISAHGAMTVVNVDKIQLDGSSVLTIHGCNDQYVFINVCGKFAMTGQTQIKLEGGITASHVIFNIIGTGEQVAFTGKSNATGTFLAVNRNIAVSGATIQGELIGGECGQIALTSGAQVIHQCDCSSS
jgi:choice-of-anchor A domain-containing protein